MAVPNSRSTFKEYCLRKLGKPVIEINVSDDQVEDRVDEALKYYWDYHFDGTELTYYKYQVTEQDKTNKYITMPENIIGSIGIFPITYPGTSTGDIFSIQYQIALNDLYQLTTESLVPYVMVMERLALLQQLLIGKQPIRYNRHRNILHIDMNWNRIDVGQWLVVEAYQVVDPATFTDVWGDRWLQNYCTQLIKRQWGSNLTKFNNMVLPGGITFNGAQIYADASAEIANMEETMISKMSLPVMDMIG